jgi:hypothetical protein
MNRSRRSSGKYSSVTNSRARSCFSRIWSLHSSGTRFVALSCESKRNQHEVRARIRARKKEQTVYCALRHGGRCRSERARLTRTEERGARPSLARTAAAAPKRTPLRVPPRAARPPRRARRRAHQRGAPRPWSCQSRAQMGQVACRGRRRRPRSSSSSARNTVHRIRSFDET